MHFTFHSNYLAFRTLPSTSSFVVLSVGSPMDDQFVTLERFFTQKSGYAVEQAGVCGQRRRT